MRIDNRTTWDTSALEQLIRAALADAGVKPGHDRVVIVYSRGGYHGRCYVGRIVKWNGHARMRLRLPRTVDELDTAKMAFLVRHEVAHWAGLRHHQMGGRLMNWPKPGEPLPEWVPAGWRCGRAEPAPKPTVDKDARRVARRQHLESKVKEYEAKLARYERLLAKWRRKLKAHDAHYQRAARKGSP